VGFDNLRCPQLFSGGRMAVRLIMPMSGPDARKEIKLRCAEAV